MKVSVDESVFYPVRVFTNRDSHVPGGGHISAVGYRIARDIRGAVLESVYVHIALNWSQAAESSVAHCFPPGRDARRSSVSEWEGIDLEEVFQTRFSVLQGCPVQLKGRFRQSVRVALEARQEAVHRGDAVQECGHGSCSYCCRFRSCGEPRDEDEWARQS